MKDRLSSGFVYHPLAGVFTSIEGDEWEAFVDDIRRHGVLVPVWTWRGQVIDGKARCEAVRALMLDGVDIDVPSREWDGVGSLVEFLYSVNVHRGHRGKKEMATLLALKKKAIRQESAEMFGRPGRGRFRVG